MSRRIVLIGCSKTKHAVVPERKRGGRVTPAELYSGQLFRKRVEYAESRSLTWYVLSAQYGVWRPRIEHKPYDLAMSDLSPADAAAWHVGVAQQLIEELWENWHEDPEADVLVPAALTVEIHAGRDYSHPLTEVLRALGVSVELPCKGLGIGEQLAKYTSGDLMPA